MRLVFWLSVWDLESDTYLYLFLFSPFSPRTSYSDFNKADLIFFLVEDESGLSAPSAPAARAASNPCHAGPRH